jgi:ATPase subunit of ABC transporter with duplicated ATPase domains
MINLHDFNSEGTKSFLRIKFKSLHKTLNRSFLAKEYYFEIAKLFNSDDAEFFSTVITEMILCYRGYHMPTKDDFMEYIKKRNAAEKQVQKSKQQKEEAHRPSKEACAEFQELAEELRGSLGNDCD